MTTCPRCGRTFARAFRESGGAVELAAGDPPPAHFVTKPEPGKPLPNRCMDDTKWTRAEPPLARPTSRGPRL